MESFLMENLCCVLLGYILLVIIAILLICHYVQKYDKDGSYDEKMYIKFRAEKEQFKVMWVSLGCLGTFTNVFPPEIRVAIVLIPILMMGYYYRRLEEFCTRQELKKEELKLKKGNE